MAEAKKKTAAKKAAAPAKSAKKSREKEAPKKEPKAVPPPEADIAAAPAASDADENAMIALSLERAAAGDKKDGRKERYVEAVGRRKTAIARVRLFTRSGDFTVNGKPYAEYFASPTLRTIVEDALQTMKLFGRFKVSVKLSGGGPRGQAEAVRHGLSRCLVEFNPNFRKRLKRSGFLTRDPRMKERKKFGLKKARRAPQWAKR